MSKPIVEVKDLGKRYKIKTKRRVDSIRDLVARQPIVSNRDEDELVEKDFWALRNVSFELAEGDVLGIIGRNGAGKSTMLKLLARITPPTEGQATIRGTVASLLEVGTGFHPELSGKENVFFNGAMLGMSKSDVASKYKEIVDFAEISKFMDTPIKQYSSGMKVRLAFSVASFLEADVMILDEALAVGDNAFRAKSLERIKQSAFTGRTVLFVSHGMGSVKDLCNIGMYLKDGKVEATGTSEEVVDIYLGETRKDLGPSWHKPKGAKAPKNALVEPTALHIVDRGKTIRSKSVPYGDDVKVVLDVDVKQIKSNMSIGLSFFDDSDRRLFRTALTDLPESVRPEVKKGKNRFTTFLPTGFLRPGPYRIVFDFDANDKELNIAPGQTEAQIGMVLENPHDIELWNPKREAIIKPRLTWKGS